MSDNQNTTEQNSGLFSGAANPSTRQEGGVPMMAWAAAGISTILVIAIVLVYGHKSSSTAPKTPDAYAASMAVSNVVMSESDVPAGGKLTYIDGTITNNGPKTVTGVTASTSFVNDMGQPPQVETQSISLIRSRDPYIDIIPVSANPIKPGESRDFRLTFEQVTPNWNQTTPPIQVLGVQTK